MGRSIYWALGMVTAATLMLQIILTRIFSVIMWYHMSLVSVSMAMFGMALGALIVNWRTESFLPDRALTACSRHSLWFALTMVGSLLVCLYTPFQFELTPWGVITTIGWNAAAALPFVFSGIVVCTALTRFPKYVGRLYAADLVGASIGCLVAVWLLNQMDAVSAIIGISSLSAIASLVFALGAKDMGSVHPEKKTRIAGLSFAFAILFFGLALANTATQTVRIQYVLGKSMDNRQWRHEFWNIFSYVTVTSPRYNAYFWGKGSKSADIKPVGEFLGIKMDTRAFTPMVRFDGDWEKVRWLLYDVTNVVHHLRPDGPVLVIGVGGGRDILSALIQSKGQRRVTGIDINPKMIALLSNFEKDYSGRIADLPNVSFHVDEARSWTERVDEKFQVITIPLVDTSAASSAGAYALTENSLYTMEAFDLYLRRLNDDGVLSVSRWWYKGKLGETHRLVGLAAQALRHRGVTDVDRHMILVLAQRLTTLLVSPTPFSDRDLKTLDVAAEQHGFQILLAPGRSASSLLSQAVGNPNWYNELSVSRILDLSPPTDDRPFFFHSYRLSNILRDSGNILKGNIGVAHFDLRAMIVLTTLLLIVTLLALAVWIVPVWRAFQLGGVSAVLDSNATMGYFAAIGFGFMFFESSQVQRLNMFLGYPVYALTVVLFTLLLSSSLGAFISGRLGSDKHAPPVRRVCLILIATMFVVGLITPWTAHQFAGSSTWVRILVAVSLMTPPGILMGMFFPFGLRLVAPRPEVSRAWCWAMNGMMSTCAAIYSIALSIALGFSFTFWMGLGCYVLTGLLAGQMIRRFADAQGS